MKIIIHEAERLAAIPHILAMAADVAARMVDAEPGEIVGVRRYDPISGCPQYFSLRRNKASIAVWHNAK